MKRWRIFLASVLALLVLIVTPLSIMAAGQVTAGTAANQVPQVHLAIVQPRAVHVGQNMQLTVFERLNQINLFMNANFLKNNLSFAIL